MHLQSSCFIKQGKEQNTHTNKKKKICHIRSFQGTLVVSYIFCVLGLQKEIPDSCALISQVTTQRSRPHGGLSFHTRHHAFLMFIALPLTPTSLWCLFSAFTLCVSHGLSSSLSSSLKSLPAL